MHKRYVRIALYSAEAYAKGMPQNNSIHFDATGKTEEEIEEIIREERAKQRELNQKFRKDHPKSAPGRKPKELGIIGPTGRRMAAELRKKNLESIFRPKFDEDTGNTFVLFGASKSGKTTLMMKIYNDYWPEYLAQKKTLTTLFAMNPQIPLYKSGKYIIKCPVNPMLDSMNIEGYIDWQRRINKSNDNKFCFLNMFDDWIDVRHKTILNNLLLTYRNSMISSVICLQYVNLLSKSARSNVNNIFLLHMNTDESIEVAVKAYLAALLKKIGIPTLQDQVQYYRDMTTNYNYIYIHPVSGCVYISKTKEYHQL